MGRTQVGKEESRGGTPVAASPHPWCSVLSIQAPGDVLVGGEVGRSCCPEAPPLLRAWQATQPSLPPRIILEAEVRVLRMGGGQRSFSGPLATPIVASGASGKVLPSLDCFFT